MHCNDLKCGDIVDFDESEDFCLGGGDVSLF